MGKKYPCIDVNLGKIKHNAKVIVDKCNEKGIQIFGVTKVFCAEESIAEVIKEAGVSGLADSRISNLKRLQNINSPKILLRIPQISQAEDVMKYADISLNSEIEVVKALSKEAVKINKIHKIILMIDLGDLREGICEEKIEYTVNEIIALPNIELYGIGTNLTCYGGVIPDDNNLGRLVEYKEFIEKRFGMKINIVSGGNSSSLYKVFDGTIIEGINNLRIGEAIVLGRETAFGKRIDKCFNDPFILKGEIVELKEKASVPKGNIGMDAFGEKPVFVDKGNMKRAIVAIGRQDVKIDGLMTLDSNIEIIGASSDHLILNVTNCNKEYKVGDVVEFNVDYGCLLQVMTSEYVFKNYI